MPVNLKKYPPNWKQIAKQVKDKAGWKCEFCGIQHGQIAISITKGTPYQIILTVAHCGDNKTNKLDTSNLKALCQPCHLRLDVDEHTANAKATREKKRLAKQPLLEGMEDTNGRSISN